MRKRLICALCFVVLSVFALASCSSDDPAQYDGVMTEVKDSAGQITGYERRYHNDNGDITRLDVYDADEVYQSFVIYEYDDSYRLTKETTYRADGIGEFYYTYTYDDDGNLYEKGWYSAKDGATRTLYDADGSEVEKYTYNSDDILTNHEVLENGEWVELPVDEETETDAE